jgi:hypothetical protein
LADVGDVAQFDALTGRLTAHDDMAERLDAVGLAEGADLAFQIAIQIARWQIATVLTNGASHIGNGQIEAAQGRWVDGHGIFGVAHAVKS